MPPVRSAAATSTPAITVAFDGFSLRKVPAYLLSQLAGAFAAAATLYGLFHNLIARFEAANDIIRGAAGSQLSAMIYGEYFPNPAEVGTMAHALASVTHAQAMLAEAVGTAFVAFFVFAVTDRLNRNRPTGTLFAPS